MSEPEYRSVELKTLFDKMLESVHETKKEILELKRLSYKMSRKEGKNVKEVLDLKENDEYANRILGITRISSENKLKTKKSLLCKIGLHDWDKKDVDNNPHIPSEGVKTCMRPACGKQEYYKKDDYSGGSFGSGPP